MITLPKSKQLIEKYDSENIIQKQKFYLNTKKKTTKNYISRKNGKRFTIFYPRFFQNFKELFNKTHFGKE